MTETGAETGTPVPAVMVTSSIEGTTIPRREAQEAEIVITLKEDITTITEETTTASEEVMTASEEVTTASEEVTIISEEMTTTSEEVTLTDLSEATDAVIHSMKIDQADTESVLMAMTAIGMKRDPVAGN